MKYYDCGGDFSKPKAQAMLANEGKAYITEGNMLTFAEDSTSYIIPCKPNTKYTISHENTNNTIFRIAYITVSESNFPDATGEAISVYGQSTLIMKKN